MTEHTTAAQFHAADGVDDRRVLYHVVSAHYPTASLAEGITLVDAIGRIVGDTAHPLKIDLRTDGVTVSLRGRDLDLAREISAAASELGLPADPSAVQHSNVTIDAFDIAAVLPFWRELLAYRQIDDYLGDPRGRGPGISYQAMDTPRPQRNRIHLDVAVPHDQAAARIAAALAAGGRLVTEAHAPKWWVLADAEGNEACVATWRGRE